MPTIRFEQESQQVGCIEGANLRKAALDAGINPYNGLNNLNPRFFDLNGDGLLDVDDFLNLLNVLGKPCGS